MLETSQQVNQNTPIALSLTPPSLSQNSNKTIYKLFDYLLMCLYVMVKIMIVPLTFVLHVVDLGIQFCGKIVKLGLAFIMNGIQGVQRMLQIGTFAQKIHYAVLKENGQYLKLTNKTLEQIFTCQLYDYAIRKFMSTSQIQQDSKVTQIQIWSSVGLSFIKQKFKIKKVSALTNSRQKINRLKNKVKEIQFQCTDYSTENLQNLQDIFIFFNRSKQHQEHKLQIDMIKVLGYIKKNLSENGYAVIGNYFNCDGDVAVFQEILDGFGFKIQMKQDITPNITHSRKVLGRIYKNRKLAWTVGKLKQFLVMAWEHDNCFSNSIRNIWRILQQLSGIKHTQNKYNLYILQHAS